MKYSACPVNSFSSTTYVENRPSIFPSYANFVSPAAPTPLPSATCALLNSLAVLFSAPPLCFQSLAHSSTKTPGVGCASLPTGQDHDSESGVTSHESRRINNLRTAPTAFSITYELLFLQPVCFHQHLRCPMLFSKDLQFFGTGQVCSPLATRHFPVLS